MPDLVTLTAHRWPWPSLQQQPKRESLSLRWDVYASTDDKLLVPRTTHPMLEGAYALACQGVDLSLLITLRHAGADFDSFQPVPLRGWALAGAKRAEGRARLAERRGAAPSLRDALWQDVADRCRA